MRRALGALLVLAATPALAGPGYWTLSGVDTLGIGAACDPLETPSRGAYEACAVERIEVAHSYWVGGGVCSHYPPELVITGTVEIGSGTWRTSYSIERRTGNFPEDCDDPGTTGVGSFQVVISPACPSGEEFDPALGDCRRPPCADLAGLWGGAIYASGAPAGPFCQAVGGDLCEVARDGHEFCNGGVCLGSGSYTGQRCSTETPGVDETAGNTACISSGGVTICAEKSEPNCGTVNGEAVCLDAIPPGKCVFLGDGGMVCEATAGSPPAPTDPTGTTPATPDGQFEGSASGGTTNNYHYYGAGTVAASGTATSGEGEGGTGSSQSGGGLEDDDEDGGTECGPGECQTPDLEEVGTFGATTSSFVARVQAAPIPAAVAGLAASMPAGVCPTPSDNVAFFDMVLTFDAHCGLWDGIKGVLSVVSLAAWVFIGARILLSA